MLNIKTSERPNWYAVVVTLLPYYLLALYFIIRTQIKVFLSFVLQDPTQYFLIQDTVSVDCHKLFFCISYFSSYRWKATSGWNIKFGNFFEKKKN